MFHKNRMNASDNTKSRQNGVLYKGYYNPVVFQSTTYTTSYPVIDVSGGNPYIAYSTLVNTVNTYTSNPYSSYELAADVNEGKYVCGGKEISVLQFKADSSIRSETIYAFSTYSTLVTNASTLSSINSYAFRPIICSDFFSQNTNC